MHEGKTKEFLAKLESLLREYNASIEAEVGDGTDTHGILDPTMTIYIGRWNDRGRVTIRACDGWELSADELRAREN